ncbi:MAG TPA: MarR family transcriptional regulator [Arenicellales bacterium]|nr:MarR family transcriptional regulator [Arenicellales bacterium]
MNKQRDFEPDIQPADARLEEEVLRSLRRIFHAVDRNSRRLARVHGLTEPQAICLTTINRVGELHPGQLARSMSLSPPTVTGILDRLERRGLIRRERAARDKRQVVVRLTDTGQKLLANSPPPLQERFTRRLVGLPLYRQRQIARSLNEVVRMLEAEDIDAAPLLARGAANPAQIEEAIPAAPRPGDAGRSTDNGR